jgi:hypothetical protein
MALFVHYMKRSVSPDVIDNTALCLLTFNTKCLYKQAHPQQIALVFEYKALYMFRPLSVAVFREYQFLKTNM